MPLALCGKDHNGQPLCFDISADKQLISIGFEDDSFISYLLDVRENGFVLEAVPIFRGVGHKNFINCIRFDTHFQINHLRYL